MIYLPFIFIGRKTLPENYLLVFSFPIFVDFIIFTAPALSLVYTHVHLFSHCKCPPSLTHTHAIEHPATCTLMCTQSHLHTQSPPTHAIPPSLTTHILYHPVSPVHTLCYPVLPTHTRYATQSHPHTCYAT